MKSPRAKIDGKGKARKVKAFAVLDRTGNPMAAFGDYFISTNKATAAMNAKCYRNARVVPCVITWRMP